MFIFPSEPVQDSLKKSLLLWQGMNSCSSCSAIAISTCGFGRSVMDWIRHEITEAGCSSMSYFCLSGLLKRMMAEEFLDVREAHS